MKNKLFLLLLLACAFPVHASPQTSKADLKAAQSVFDGLTFCNVSADQADTHTFHDCTFVGTCGAADHRLKTTGTATFGVTGSDPSLASYSVFITGNLGSSYSLTDNCSGAANNQGSNQSIDLDGQVDRVSESANATANGSYYFATNQVSALEADFSITNATGVSMTVTASHATAFTLGSFNKDAGTCGLSLFCYAATSVDLTAFTESSGGSFENFVFSAATSPAIAASIHTQDSSSWWTGPFTSTFVDALLSAYAAGGTSDTSIQIGGDPRTAASDTAVSALVADGCTITTN